MERIFKVKTKTNPDPRFQYPSERRYSASIVLGFSIVFLQLFLYATLMGTLIIRKMTTHQRIINGTEELSFENVTEQMATTENALRRLHERVGNDLENARDPHYYINVPALVCAGCFIMALGSIFSFATGILAWKKWYVDHNITFFFLSSSFSALTSAMCLLLSVLTALSMSFDYGEYQSSHGSSITFSLAMNIVILSSVGVIWSVLSTNVSYRGMKNYYPDDLVTSKGGRTVEASTIRKGSKTCSNLPPDLINHFPQSGKVAKYLPKKDNSVLPNAESSYEYQQRVDKFLSGKADSTE